MSSELCKMHGVTSIKKLMEKSAYIGDIDTVKKCLELSPIKGKQLNTSLLNAVRNNHSEIAWLLCERGVVDLYEPMACAIRYEYTEIAHFLQWWVIERFDRAMLNAEKGGETELAEDYRKRKAKLLEEYQERETFMLGAH